jgi:periplasmic protein TonB
MLFEFAQRKYSHDRYRRALVVSIVLHTCVIAALIMTPLILFHKLPAVELVAFLYDTPEPPPPPPALVPPVPTRHQQSQTVITKFTVPREIPKAIPPPESENEAPIIDKNFINSGSVGVSGGVAGGSALGILGGILGKQAPPPPPPPPKEPPALPAKIPAKPIFVGGDIQAAKLIYSKPAVYPDLALKARISGVVLLRITVDEEGKVADIKVVSGHPLLVPAAVDAVHSWKYSPTLLNGHAVQVIATVAVNFQLQ